MIVIGDCHGEYDLLMKLFEKLPHDNVCFVGDLIDRGLKSKEVVDFVKKNNYNCVMGNHEDFAIQTYDDNLDKDFITYQMWMQNGGYSTLESYKDDMDLFFEHREWFKTLPLFYWIDDKTVVSHSYYLPYIGQEEDEYFSDNVLWGRTYIFIEEDILNIVGHSIVKYVSYYKNYVNIDTGANYYGKLSAYDPETDKVYCVEKE